MFDAPYFSGRLRRSSVPSEAAGEGMTSYLLLSALALKKPERTGLSRFESVVASNPNVKATVSEAIIHIYYWFGYHSLGVKRRKRNKTQSVLFFLYLVREFKEKSECT